MARAATGWGVRDLAERSGVSVPTIVRYEHGQPIKPITIAAIRAVFEAAGVTFVESAEGAGVYLKQA
jgi:transcriptional regulator with XRE-family HTH domain